MDFHTTTCAPSASRTDSQSCNGNGSSDLLPSFQPMTPTETDKSNNMPQPLTLATYKARKCRSNQYRKSITSDASGTTCDFQVRQLVVMKRYFL